MNIVAFLIRQLTKRLPRRLSQKVVCRLPYAIRAFDAVVSYRGVKLKINTDDSVGKVLYWMDEYKPTQMRFFESLLRPGMFLWDFGANIGTYDAIAVKRGVRTIAFEPDPSLCQYYIRPVVAMNGGIGLCKVIAEAVSDRKGTMTFWLHRLGNLGAGRVFRVKDLEESPTITVNTDTLDGYVERYGWPDLVKMHIEGAETLAIRGSHRIFKRADAPMLIIEFHNEDIEAITPDTTVNALIDELKGYGYRFATITEPKYRESMWHIFYKGDLPEEAKKCLTVETQTLGGYQLK